MSWELSHISRKLEREVGRACGIGGRIERDALRWTEGCMRGCMLGSNVSPGRVESTDLSFCNSSSPADTHSYCSLEHSLVKANQKGRTVSVPFLMLRAIFSHPCQEYKLLADTAVSHLAFSFSLISPVLCSYPFLGGKQCGP